MKVNGKDDIPYMKWFFKKKQKKHVWKHQPEMMDIHPRIPWLISEAPFISTNDNVMGSFNGIVMDNDDNNGLIMG